MADPRATDHLLYAPKATDTSDGSLDTDHLLEAIELRRLKKLQQDQKDREEFAEYSDDEEEDDSETDVAVLIVAVSFCILVFAIIVLYTYPDQMESSQQHHRNQGRQRQRQRGRRAKSIQVDVSISLTDLYKGIEKKVTINRQIVCSGDQQSCQNDLCRGSKVQVHAVRDMWSGAIDRTFYCRKTVPIMGTINPGTKAGDQIRINSKGNISPGMAQGDVLLKINELSHRVYRREGSILHTSITISLKEALMGWSRKLKALDGKLFEIDSSHTTNGQQYSDGTTSPGEIVIIKGLGFPKSINSKYYGDLHVTTTVKFPKIKVLKDDVAEQVDLIF
tara:strand:+ start:62 stop:1063 length:1002 start_codon:yes stop_codon:yes gene_type:complete